MMMRHIFRTGMLLSMLAASGCGSQAFRVAERFSLDMPWNNYERMVVTTRNGSISLVNDGAEQIEIRGEKHARGPTVREARVLLDQIQIVAQASDADSDVFMVELVTPDSLHGKNLGASFEIRIPAGCAAELRTGNGDINARLLKDQLVMKTCNGKIYAQEIEGSVEATSSNGRIHLVYINGPVTADTCNGRIIADGVAGDCVLSTSNGDITAREIKGAVRAETSNGDIKVNANQSAEDVVYMHTSNGDITAELTPTTRGELELSMSNGRLHTSFGEASLTDVQQSKRSFRAMLNGGGAGRIEGKTTNGSIILNCR